MINTETTNANSDALASTSMPHKQQQFWQGDPSSQAMAIALAQTQQLSMHLQNSSVGSNQHALDDNRRDMILKNAKSLGNSLGTANKKSLNMSNHCDKML